ncbi:hypothetical protein KY326_02855 [Candidatus Woesearchaeota archaeon]|nr:hypothetical protein [Candidatus Woesearchaeota archaeon]
MKKIICIAIFALIFIVSVSLINSEFYQEKPSIIDVEVTPLKVRPGIPLKINVKVQSNNEIESAYAKFNFENGSDTLRMVRVYSNNNIEEFSSVWLTHDTLDKKWYTTDLIITDKNGEVLEKTVEWQDPRVVSHNWSEMTGGGYCIASFNHTTCPDGYTALSTSNPNSVGKFLKGNSSNVGTVGGSQTHSHTVNGTIGANLEYPSGAEIGSNSYTVADKEHYHNYNVVTADSSGMPKYYKLTICCRD